MKPLILLGLIFDFVGVVLLWVHAEKIIGMVTRADQHQARWSQRMGYGLIAVGFALQIVGTGWG